MPHNTSLTVQDVIDLILEKIPGAPFVQTVDTIKTGQPDQEVSGVATTFLATYDVVRRAIDAGADFIITHEPTFYNHEDRVDWLAEDPVYLEKRRLIEAHGVAIWRFHDYWHSHLPDGIITGMLARLGWSDCADAEHPALCSIAGMTVAEVVETFKEKLGMASLRVIGDPDLVCHTLRLSVGFGGGRRQIEALRDPDLNLLVAGEILEWETAEYVRDAVSMGEKKALIVLGHANSEEAGMEWLVEWLQPKIPQIPVTFVPAHDPFVVM